MHLDLLLEQADENLFLGKESPVDNKVHLEAAMSLYSTILRVDPTNFEARVGQGSTNFLLGRPDLAIPDYELALDSMPPEMDLDAEIEFNLGYGFLLFEVGRFEDALKVTTKVIDELDDDCFGAYSRRAGILLDLGRNEESLSDCRKMEGLNPQIKKDPNYHGVMGKLLFRMGRTEEAIARFTTGIQISDTGQHHHLAYRGDAYRISDNRESAVADYHETMGLFFATPEDRRDKSLYLSVIRAERGLNQLQTLTNRFVPRALDSGVLNQKEIDDHFQYDPEQ